MNKLLRTIPKVDDILARPALAGFGGFLFLQAIREVLATIREEILNGNITTVPSFEELETRIITQYKYNTKPRLQRVINATGIVLHTNLGRAPLATKALDAIVQAAQGYATLEYNISDGKRGSRHALVADLLTTLTGAADAMVVNNNAAADLLALSIMAERDVVVSRGELVEIGGAFRIPDVCTQSGCRLFEVGTTNKTHLYDYENALAQGTVGAILRVHSSNFKMSGFVSRPRLVDLAKLAQQYQLPLIEDLGSGALVSVCGQPTVAQSIKDGADVVTFSGDKLLGGPQAGIIVGKKIFIEQMKKHPLARALRIDKLSLAALEATLRLYVDEQLSEIPVLQMLHITEDMLMQKASTLREILTTAKTFDIQILPLQGLAGGGAMPEETIPSVGIIIKHPSLSAQRIESLFRMGAFPIIGRIAQDAFILDVRCIHESEFIAITQRLVEMEAEGLV